MSIPFLDSNVRHLIRGIYLDIRSSTLYIAIRTRGYLKQPQMMSRVKTHLEHQNIGN